MYILKNNITTYIRIYVLRLPHSITSVIISVWRIVIILWQKQTIRPNQNHRRCQTKTSLEFTALKPTTINSAELRLLKTICSKPFLAPANGCYIFKSSRRYLLRTSIYIYIYKLYIYEERERSVDPWPVYIFMYTYISSSTGLYIFIYMCMDENIFGYISICLSCVLIILSMYIEPSQQLVWSVSYLE